MKTFLIFYVVVGLLCYGCVQYAALRQDLKTELTKPGPGLILVLLWPLPVILEIWKVLKSLAEPGCRGCREAKEPRDLGKSFTHHNP